MTRYKAVNENSIEFLRGSDQATVTLSEPRLINRIRKLAKEQPDKVQILADGPKNGGYCFAHIPASWIRINPDRVLTEDQKRKLAENLPIHRRESGPISR